MADVTKKSLSKRLKKPSKADDGGLALTGQALIAINYYLGGMSPSRAASEAGLSTWQFRQIRKSDDGKAYLASVYAEIVDMRRDMVVQALATIKTNMSDTDAAIAQRAAESVIRHLGTRPDGNLDEAGTTQTAKLSATEVARAIVNEVAAQTKQIIQ